MMVSPSWRAKSKPGEDAGSADSSGYRRDRGRSMTPLCSRQGRTDYRRVGHLSAPRGLVVDRDAYEVADRDDADRPPLIDDRQMAEAAVDHDRGGVRGRVVRADGLGIARHPGADPRAGDIPGRNGAQHVPLGEDSGHAPVRKHEYRAHV